MAGLALQLLLHQPLMPLVEDYMLVDAGGCELGRGARGDTQDTVEKGNVVDDDLPIKRVKRSQVCTWRAT